jgi:tungstate transport system permease protein
VELIAAGDPELVADHRAVAQGDPDGGADRLRRSACRSARRWRCCAFPAAGRVVVLFNALMGLPPVVAGLVVYLLLSRSGPLGALALLFTPTAMVIAQTILILPIVVSLTRSVIEDLWRNTRSSFARSAPRRCAPCRRCSGTGASACSPGSWRASAGRCAEVGAVLIVGGNIAGHTR